MYTTPRKCHRQVFDLMARYLVFGLPRRLDRNTSEYVSDGQVISRIGTDDPADIAACRVLSSDPELTWGRRSADQHNAISESKSHSR
jgi:hypothetical protein